MKAPLFVVAEAKKKAPSVCGCGSCKVKACAKSGTLFKGAVVGKGREKILILMSSPESCEDSMGKLWETDDSFSGVLLREFKQIFDKTSLDIHKDCWRMNATQCAPRNKGKKFGNQGAELCRPDILAKIKELKPKVILAFGSAALTSLYGHRTHKFNMMIDTWHGFKIPDIELGAWVVPCFDIKTMASCYREIDGDYRKKEVFKVLAKEMARTIEMAYNQRDVPITDFFKKAIDLCTYDVSSEEVLAFLRKIKAGDTISFDYEASGIKPDFRNQFIKCVSVYSKHLNRCFSFLIDTREECFSAEREELKRILKDPNIEKVGQNCKFETRWTKTLLKVPVKNWIWDTMLGAHCLYNSRKGATGLKFQTAVHFGVTNYNSSVEYYLSNPSGNHGKGDNQLNMIDAIGIPDLLKYCALDSVFTFWLYQRQKKALSKWENMLDEGTTHIKGNKFLLDSTMAFADMEEAGSFIDREYLKRQKTECDKNIALLEEEFKKTELYKRWRQAFRNVNLGSGKQLSHVLYKVMGLKQKKKTDSGEDSTDKEALLSLSLPDLAPYFRMNLLKKARGTYIKQITRELVGDFIHTVFTLHVVSSFRSSSNSPNLQNQPNRNKDIGIIIRGAFVSRFGKDGVLIEADLKGAEVSTSACYHHDPKFISYVSDQNNDMHKDTMALLMCSDPDDITKELRHIAKNKFVFPEFYGDWYGSCAEVIWVEIQKLKMKDGTPALVWLQNKGLFKLPKSWKEGVILVQEQNPKVYLPFLDHIGEVEHKFWHEMFPVYTEWKEEWWQKYLEYGYVDSYTGFRYTGIMDKKKTINYPIQGDAYHLNQRGANINNALLRKNKLKAVLSNQIHDSQIYDVHKRDFLEVITMVNSTMNVRIRKLYPWVCVPIIVEIEATLPGESWFHKKPFSLETMDFAKK